MMLLSSFAQKRLVQNGSPLNLIWVNIRHEFRAESSEIQFINHTEERN